VTTDTDLVTAARTGNQEASAAIYVRYQSRVMAVGRSMLRSQQSTVEDMAQDVWLKVFARLGTFDGDSTLGTWIGRIAINECLKILRRWRQTSNGDAHLVPLDMVVDGEGFTAETWLGVEDAALTNVPAKLDLEKILGAMKPLDRRALTLAYLEGWSEKEVAEQLWLPVKSVKSKLRHAKRRARERHSAQPARANHPPTLTEIKDLRAVNLSCTRSATDCGILSVR
jgi:RNA polymerase sigma-70 factor, ECF subfamily